MKVATISDEELNKIGILVFSLPSSKLRNEVQEILVKITEDLKEN